MQNQSQPGAKVLTPHHQTSSSLSRLPPQDPNQLRELLTEQDISQLKTLINAERSTKALPKIRSNFSTSQFQSAFAGSMGWDKVQGHVQGHSKSQFKSLRERGVREGKRAVETNLLKNFVVKKYRQPHSTLSKVQSQKNLASESAAGQGSPLFQNSSIAQEYISLLQQGPALESASMMDAANYGSNPFSQSVLQQQMNYSLAFAGLSAGSYSSELGKDYYLNAGKFLMAQPALTLQKIYPSLNSQVLPNFSSPNLHQGYKTSVNFQQYSQKFEGKGLGSPTQLNQVALKRKQSQQDNKAQDSFQKQSLEQSLEMNDDQDHNQGIDSLKDIKNTTSPTQFRVNIVNYNTVSSKQSERQDSSMIKSQKEFYQKSQESVANHSVPEEESQSPKSLMQSKLDDTENLRTLEGDEADEEKLSLDNGENNVKIIDEQDLQAQTELYVQSQRNHSLIENQGSTQKYLRRNIEDQQNNSY